MKRKVIAGVAVVLCVVLAYAGYEKEPKEAEVVQDEEVQDETEEEEELRVIGEDNDGAFVVKITNETGQDITAIAVKGSSEEEWPDSMIGEGEEILEDETVKFCYTPDEEKPEEEKAEKEETEEAEEKKENAEQDKTAADTDKKVTETYDVTITLADESSYVLTGFAFEDMEEGTLKLEDEVAFVEYESKKSKEIVSTKEQELGLKAKAEEEAKAKAEAEAKAKAEAEAKAKAEAEAKAAAEAAAAAAAAQTYEPVYEPVYEPTYVAPQQTQQPEQSSEGCLQ